MGEALFSSGRKSWLWCLKWCACQSHASLAQIGIQPSIRCVVATRWSSTEPMQVKTQIPALQQYLINYDLTLWINNHYKIYIKTRWNYQNHWYVNRYSYRDVLQSLHIQRLWEMHITKKWLHALHKKAYQSFHASGDECKYES